MTCTWYAADHDTATGPADYQSFGSFADALASTTSFTAPVLVWGSLAAYLAHDGSADFVDMIFTPGFINHGWNWVIGPTSQHIGHSGAGGLLTAQAALEGVLASPYTPDGFCLETIPMNCDPNALIEAAKCFRCLPPGMTREMLVYLLCQWANSTACTLPTAPVDLGVTAGDSQNTLNWPAGVGATGYNIKRSLVPGGPYTVIGTSAASPYVDHTAVNYTTYYYVVSSTNACGESAGNSVESHGRPFIPFSYVPATAIIGWNDANGAGHSGNLAFFNATADFASVTDIGLATQGLTSISNLQALPLLATIDVTFNSLTTLDVSGMTHLWYVGCYGNFGMLTLNVTGCTGLTTLASTFCALITVDISTCPLLIYVALQNNSLPVLVVNTVLTQLVAFGHTGGTVTLIGQTPAAPPSVGPPNGIAAKAALLAEVPAWTVTTD